MERIDFEQEFPKLIRKAREDRGMTQAELSKLSGVDSTHISHFESGRRSPDLYNFCRLATALKLTIKNIYNSAN